LCTTLGTPLICIPRRLIRRSTPGPNGEPRPLWFPFQLHYWGFGTGDAKRQPPTDDPNLGRPPQSLAAALAKEGAVHATGGAINADASETINEDEDVRQERELALSRQAATSGLCVRNLSAVYAQGLIC